MEKSIIGTITQHTSDNLADYILQMDILQGVSFYCLIKLWFSLQYLSPCFRYVLDDGLIVIAKPWAEIDNVVWLALGFELFVEYLEKCR